MGRRVIFAFVGVALVASGLAFQSIPGLVAFRGTLHVRPFIKYAHLTRSLLVDGGALRLDPAIGGAGMDETRAFELWQAQGSSGSYHIARNLDGFLTCPTLSS